MKITKDTLKQLIKEELENVLSEDADQAYGHSRRLAKDFKSAIEEMESKGMDPKMWTKFSAFDDATRNGWAKQAGFDFSGSGQDWQWTVWLYDKNAIPEERPDKRRNEGVEAEDVLTEDAVAKAKKRMNDQCPGPECKKWTDRYNDAKKSAQKAKR